MFGSKQLSMRQEVICTQTNGHTCFGMKIKLSKIPWTRYIYLHKHYNENLLWSFSIPQNSVLKSGSHSHPKEKL